jgi:CRP/FNR family transcriptional regulator, cyclic AMP receptor protein
MTDSKLNNFDPVDFLAKAGLGRRIIQFRAKEAFFSHGDADDAVFYLQRGRAPVTVISVAGKINLPNCFTEGFIYNRYAWSNQVGVRIF